jgi:hypothetical protein
MLYNPKKCNIMPITRRTVKHRFYHLSGVPLDWVEVCTYLGVTITKELKWTSHATACAKKANARLGFLRRNL